MAFLSLIRLRYPIETSFGTLPIAALDLLFNIVRERSEEFVYKASRFPCFCVDLFRTIHHTLLVVSLAQFLRNRSVLLPVPLRPATNPALNGVLQVTISVVEIYNEQPRDLLLSKKEYQENKKGCAFCRVLTLCTGCG